MTDHQDEVRAPSTAAKFLKNFQARLPTRLNLVPPLPCRPDTTTPGQPHKGKGQPAARRGPALGLVDTQTTHTPTPAEVTIDPIRSRISRMKRSIITSAELLRDQCYQKKPAMITLTYVDGDDWAPEHITRFLNTVRNYLSRRGEEFPYLWVAEMQKRGVIHYHICTWLPRGVTLPKPDKRGWWPHGSTRIEWARKPVGYMVKYASKGAEGPRLPFSARMFGAGGLSKAKRLTRAYKCAPSWVRDAFEEEDEPKRAVGGGWFSRITGDWLPSPWDVHFLGGKIILKTRETLCP